MAVSGWLVLLVAAGIVPVVLLDAPVVLWWWLLGVAVLVAVDLLLAASPRALRFERELPARTRLGESVTARLLITNPARRSLRGVVRDAWQPSAGAVRTRHRITVPAGERRAVETRLRPFRRGERRAEHVTVRSFGPLRLAARQATVAVTGTLRVLPPFASRKHLPSRLARLRELDGRTSVMIRGQGTEFDSLREYVRGDDVRSIDWRATARRTDPTGAQKLVVRTWRPERDRRVVIVVDTGRLSAARVGDEPRIDTAFESSLLLGALASHAGDRVDLVMVDRRVRGRVQGATGAELLTRMVEAMAPVEPELIETDWAAVPGIVRSVTTQRALLVLLTAIDGIGSSRSLLSVLPQLTEKHLVMVASVSDPAEVEAARQRGDAREVYRAAAAERSLLDAGRVAAAINRLGGEVVLGAPAELPPAVADRYLALKAAGRL
ncbi:DUF58 domain-containing protein [Ruicaihuangia caeni]|uniref:DUF58 domain-containing protein n=1 Tax=Ruicaihuangia caeni TaxID=3042517 RepID=UPI00338EDC17